MTASRTSFPARRMAAERNRHKILDAARSAFADPDAEISMAEVARRAGVGMATLYRNFPGRRELLEALYADEVDGVCAAAATAPGHHPGPEFVAWLRRLYTFVANKRLIIAELLQHTEPGTAVPGNRARATAAARPLLRAAQEAGEIRADLTLEQVFDLVVAIATIPGTPAYLAPVFETMLDGLRAPRS